MSLSISHIVMADRMRAAVAKLFPSVSRNIWEVLCDRCTRAVSHQDMRDTRKDSILFVRE